MSAHPQTFVILNEVKDPCIGCCSFRSGTGRENKDNGKGEIQGSIRYAQDDEGFGGRAMDEEYAYVYILANGFKKLYIGITTEIEIRVRQHKEKVHPDCHTARYNIDQLVYFERFVDIEAAIAREKRLKGWLRIRKIQLIVGANPTWKDLSADWGKQMQLYQWPEEDERRSRT